MDELNQRRMRKTISQVARESGQPEAAVRREMEEAIERAWRNPDRMARENFAALFGGRKPTPEEFILKVSREVAAG